MPRRIAALTAAAVLLSFVPSGRAIDLDSAYLADIRSGIELTFTDHYGQARAKFRELIAADGRDHAAYLMLAGVYHAEMIDREDYSDEEVFAALADTAMLFAEQALERQDNPAWAHLTIGNAHGYYAALEGKSGSWWQAVRRGMKAKNHWLKALELDPALYDAYLGLGNYHYWKSAKTEFINWLPLIKDRKDQGIEELQSAIDSSLFSGVLAANSLVWIYLDYGRPFKALATASDLARRYPQSRMVMWGLAFAAYVSGRKLQAIRYFGMIIDQIERQQHNYFNLIECRYHRAQLFQQLGQDAAAAAECRRILDYPISDEVRDRQKRKIDQAAKLLRRLEKKDSSH